MVVERRLETSKLQALGMIEAYGLTAGIEATDAMLKAVDIELMGSEKIGAGLVTAMVQGDMGVVEVATETGAEAASRVGGYVSVHVTPGSHGSVGVVLPQAKQGGRQQYEGEESQTIIYHDAIAEQLARIIVDAVKQELNREPPVPTGIPVCHIHLERRRTNQLFGYSHQLQVKKVLSQPGQCAYEGTLDVTGPKGILKGVRVLGPERNQSQMEVALTDARVLGVTPPVRTPGGLTGAPDILLRGPEGGVALEQDVIVANRHIHTSPEGAARFHMKDKELVQTEIDGGRPDIVGHVRIRVSNDYAPNFHIDTSGGNAFLLKQGRPIKVLTAQEKEQNIILGTMKGIVVSTREVDNLVGHKSLLVEPYFGNQSKIIVTGNIIEAGIREPVLVTMDETTQHALTKEAPVDAFIAGIADNPPVIGK